MIKVVLSLGFLASVEIPSQSIVESAFFDV
jgi:hypothetical protein